MKPDVTTYAKAVDALDRVLSLPKDDITRDATIQRFEFCVEFAWKTARRVMGTSATAPKQVVREKDQRNLSSHTYNEELAEQVYQFAQDFLQRAQGLKKRLEES